ncbi:hypothetical protein AVEN_16648-1 [Araneus ventricosus]|uniref:Uncharacterized protein n=1 Tax=Araneus ventricosus TaxID=182803 RepID=A0A4Y2L051_ARAVE|nr:hypothetical protein AVEN_16648-1 [Araneus ventricosus]
MRAIFGTDLVIFNQGQVTRTTPELAPPSPNFHTTLTGGRLAITHDLACNRPHTRRVFSGIGPRTQNPPAPKPRPYHHGLYGRRGRRIVKYISFQNSSKSHAKKPYYVEI